jgi:hypothetical protein
MTTWTPSTIATPFEYHMRLHQQLSDTSGVNKKKSNAVSLKNPDYCAWCFKNTGKKWNNHSEATCNNKKRTEGGGGVGGGGGGGGGGGKTRVCYACQSTEHVAKDCPLLAKVRAMMWNHLRVQWQGQPLDLLRKIHEEIHLQNTLEASGYRSPT